MVEALQMFNNHVCRQFVELAAVINTNGMFWSNIVYILLMKVYEYHKGLSNGIFFSWLEET